MRVTREVSGRSGRRRGSQKLGTAARGRGRRLGLRQGWRCEGRHERDRASSYAGRELAARGGCSSPAAVVVR